MHRVYFIMGVSGSGKTTVGQLLAKKLGILFLEGDDFHSAHNKAKMARGEALTDEDRLPWLQAIHVSLKALSKKQPVVVACSALKESYRQQLAQGLSPVEWICLVGEEALLRSRLEARKGHYMPPSLLASQLAILDVPAGALVLDTSQTPSAILHHLFQALAAKQVPAPAATTAPAPSTTTTTAAPKSELGIVGLGVMGKALARNAAEKNIPLSVYNQFVAGKEEQVAARWVAADPLRAKVQAFEDLAAFVQSLARPRKIILMVPAGAATAALAAALEKRLAPGDLVLDFGNAHPAQTHAQEKAWKEKGWQWLGCGISGGELGAYQGPALFCGGDPVAFESVRPLLETLAAKDFRGNSCTVWVGPGGMGHFAKMVHNGIEYAEMQLLAEAYHLLHKGRAFAAPQVAHVLQGWQATATESYLLGITIDILQHQENQALVLDQILDVAVGKGTGSWAVTASVELQQPATLMAAALQARYASALWTDRQAAQKAWEKTLHPPLDLDPAVLHQAYALARVVNHQQGLDLLRAQANHEQQPLDLAALAAAWTNGCIIRSRLAQTIAELGTAAPQLLFHPSLATLRLEGYKALQQTVAAAAVAGIAVPALSAALQYVQSLATPQSPMNLVQAQRDFFGAHGYQRKDDPQGPPVHTHWEPAGNK